MAFSPPPGWSGSRRYWDAALPHLSARIPLIYAIDLRWHGDSAADAPAACCLPGCSVRRLAGDLYDFLRSDGVPIDVPVVLCGSSMGAAVIWGLIESYGQSRVAGAIFIDQVGSPTAAQSSHHDFCCCALHQSSSASFLPSR